MLASLGASRRLAAQTTTVTSERSEYEAARIDAALIRLGREVDPKPDGKILEGIDVMTLEVIEVDDPAPRFLNVLHTTTRGDVLRREVLVRVGEKYRQYPIDETVRNLRSFQQLSLVVAVPVKGTAEDRVRLLLVTKDVWSLRPNFDMKLSNGGLDVLRFEPTERNIAGTLDSAVTRFELLPKTLTLGAAYIAPRFSHLRLYSLVEGNIILNRDTGAPEGTAGRVVVSSPQYSVDTRTAWTLETRWYDAYLRRYVGAKEVTFETDLTPGPDGISSKVHARDFVETATFVRSFGRAHKVDLSFGAEASLHKTRGLDPSAYDPRIVAEFAARLPVPDSRVAPWMQLRAYEGRFLRVHDVDLLGFEEDYRIGYDLWVRMYPVTRALGSTRNFLGVAGAAQYVLPLADGFARTTVEAQTELTADGAPIPTLYAAANAQLVTPRIGGFARVVLDGMAIARPYNYRGARSGLGGEGRLRGYPTNAFLGENLVVYNIELRTAPLELASLQIGAAAFLDIGDTFDRNDIHLKSSVGFGLRGLVPQLDRKVMRVDIAFPMIRGVGQGPVGFFVAFEQAFPVGGLRPAGPVPAQAIINPFGGALQ